MEFSPITKQYWKEEDWQGLAQANNFKDMYAIAMRVLGRMPQPVVAVCGPISASGGLGSQEANLDLFNKTILELQQKGLNLFDQMPYEDKIQEIKINLSDSVFIESLNADFYEPIFESGIISEFYFIKGWETSAGAKWEHEKVQKLGYKINYL